MSGGVLGACVQRDMMVLTGEVGIKVQGVAMKDCCFAHRVTEFQMYSLKVFNCARLEVKFYLERLRGEIVLGIGCVKDGLLELLGDGAFVKTGDVEAMEVSPGPKIALLKLLIVDDFVRKGHHAEVSLGWEESTTGLQEHVPCDDVSLKHTLVKQERS